MKSGTLYEQGEILLVPFPFTDLSSIKRRPVLILSNSQYNSRSEDIVTCGITSNLKDSNFSVLIDDRNLISGKLPIQSIIKVDKLFTLNQRLIRRRLAKTNQKTFNLVKKELFKLI